MNGSGVTERRVWAARIGLVLGVGLLLGRLGPFDTFGELTTGARYVYWIGLTLLLWVQSLAALAMLRAAWPDWRPTFLTTLSAIAGAIPTAFEVAWAEMLLRVQRDLGIIDVAMIFGDVVLLSIPLLFATQIALGAASAGRIPASVEKSSDNADWLIAKLPPERRGQLLALESEDHYVRVRTMSGDQLVYMRFGDAVARLGPALGCQVHRGWWVARQAVRSQRRDGDRIIVELLDGTQVPVSRSYALAARQAGLIAAS